MLSMDNIKYNQEPLLHMFQFSSEKNTVKFKTCSPNRSSSKNYSIDIKR